jgi:small neutral amino acid transporter SnatA (MarC family)
VATSAWDGGVTMIQKFFLAFIPIFVAIDPIGLVAIFMGLAGNASQEQRKREGLLGIVTALCVAVGFVFLGEIIFDALGITDADFQVAGVSFCLAWRAANCLGLEQPIVRLATISASSRSVCRSSPDRRY